MSTGVLEFTASLYTKNSADTNILIAGLESSTYGRVFYVKEATGNTSFTLTPRSPNTIETASQLTVQPYECATLLANTNRFNLLNLYRGYSVFGSSTAVPGGTTEVSPSIDSSTVFLDLTSGSKVVKLPKISGTANAADSNQSLFLSIKDLNGNANTNNFYISSVGGDFIDRYGSICISDSYGCIELGADPRLNVWHVLNYFPGSTPEVISVSPGTTVSTMVVNVADDNTGNKDLDLPDTNTNVGKMILVRNSSDYLNPAFNTYLRCVGADVIDGAQTGLALSNKYQTVKLLARAPGQWTYLQNFTTGLP